MKGNKIAILGDLLYDCFIYADRLPREGETVTGYMSTFLASGKGGNQAAVCAKLGAQALMLGKVGADERGAFILKTMRENGVNVDGVIVDNEHPTGTDCVMVAEGGHNLIVVAPNANATVTDAEVDAMRPVFESAQSALFQLQVNADAVERGMRLAGECGCVVILNPAPACEIPDSMLAQADYVTPNETEAEFFTGVYQKDLPMEQWRRAAAEKLRARGARRVVITMGEHGAYYLDGERELVVPAFKIHALDSTAAGDAFNGGLAVSLAEGKSIEEALRIASACGAITASRRGSLPSLPDASELEQFLNEQKEGQL